ncbi:hypothetical protein BDZ94DRAFT_1175763 [Collybia nuda]|uniref:Homeobox domain-containing protein n=1 Tax=Collybia nuda TaxID=64659 RepID=A0A9P6CDT6_9AGAR|nr:hypothetical protein BDZ94DRAFT_1175763 [Collybia nuda]
MTRITHISTHNLSKTIHIPSIPCEISSLPPSRQRTLKRSNTSNGLNTAQKAPGPSRPIGLRKKQTHRSLRIHRNIKGELRARQKENLAFAMRIKSLENSPVNDRQLCVLRMVYDEITMYPSESWIALLAIALHRAFKQVKNWFSNERQKHRVGDSVFVFTDAGDKIRLRPLALQFRSDWSDSFFEEVIMIYHYRVRRCMRVIQ